MSEDAIDDAWAVASYLGDADVLLSTFRGMLARYNEAENVLQSAAASVAVRGVLFGNAHPLPSRLHQRLELILYLSKGLCLSNINNSFEHAGGMLFAGQSSGRLSNHRCAIR
jgi:uncharacterized membrane protein YjfL (UPF0719 family)